MPWHAQLELDYQRRDGATRLTHRHQGPLRIFQSLYPEGDAVCHNVVVHPPGGLVGGDTLDIRVCVQAGAHAFVGTPGATRFYRSEGEPAHQRVVADLQPGARLEWLPLEALAFSGCQAHNDLRLTLAPGAEALFWDVLALGQPAAGRPFERGEIHQHLEIPGLWLERSRIAADDTRLLDAPLGLDGQRCLGLLAFAAGTPLEVARRDALLDAAREVIDNGALRERAGATSPNPQMVVVRVLGPVVEPVMALLQRVWAAWRPLAWGLAPQRPRVWDV